MADTALLSGDARLLTLKIAAPGVTAMLASSACQLFEALVLAQNDMPLSAAVGACLALILLEQTVGFTLGMGAGSFVSRCIGQSSVRHTSSSARQSHREAAGRAAGAAFFSALLLSGLLLIGGFFLAAPLLRLLGAPESAVSAGMRGMCLPAGRPCAAAWYSAVYCARRAKRSRIWPPRSSVRRSAQRCWLRSASA